MRVTTAGIGRSSAFDCSLSGEPHCCTNGAQASSVGTVVVGVWVATAGASRPKLGLDQLAIRTMFTTYARAATPSRARKSHSAHDGRSGSVSTESEGADGVPSESVERFWRKYSP
jgi:hypothetical protein